MQEQLAQQVAELTAEVNRIATELKLSNENQPIEVVAAQARVDAAVADLRAEKSKPTQWSTRTQDANALLKLHWTLEQAVADAKRNRAIVGKDFDAAIAAKQRELYAAQKLLATAQEQQKSGGHFLFVAND